MNETELSGLLSNGVPSQRLSTCLAAIQISSEVVRE